MNDLSAPRTVPHVYNGVPFWNSSCNRLGLREFAPRIRFCVVRSGTLDNLVIPSHRRK
jgi:hypothetical protein